MKNFLKKSLIILFFLVSFNFYSQEIIKIDKNIGNSNRLVNNKITNLLNAIDIIFIQPNGIIKYSSVNAKTIELDYRDINYVQAVQQPYKSNIKQAVLKIKSNHSGSINLESLNQFPALDFIYLIVEKNSTDIALTSSIVESNPNWTIAYQISLPE